MEHRELTGEIIGCAMRVHTALGAGFLESVYQNALACELIAAGHDPQCQTRIAVRYKGVVVGEFVADMLVDGKVLVEIKAASAVASAHEAQLVNYLTATNTNVGLLINFGAPRLQLKRKVRCLSPRGQSSEVIL